MIIAQHPGPRRGKRRRQRRAPQRDVAVAHVAGRRVAEQGQEPVEQQLGLDQHRVHVVAWHMILHARLHRQRIRRALAVQRRQEIGGDFVTRLDRRRRIAFDDQFVAEILKHQQTGVAVGGIDARRRQAEHAQAPRHGDERRDALGQMRDGAVRFSVAHRRPVWAARRIHQDVAFAVMRQPLIGACRSVALDAVARRQAEAAVVEKAADRGDALGARGEGAVAGDLRIAVGLAARRRQSKRDVEPVGRQHRTGAVGPFQQHHGGFRRVLEAKLVQLGWIGQPVQIGMHHWKARQVITLRQREGRARHFNRFVAGDVADEGAGKGGLAGAEIARQRDQVARLDQPGNVRHQPLRGLLVLERHREAVAAGHCGGHRIIRKGASSL